MENKKLALAYLTMGNKYLSLAENVLQEMVNSGNPHLIVTEDEEVWGEYFEKTKWSDFNTIFPALFLFYHGVELTIKGFFPLRGIKIPPNHKDLLNTLKTTNSEELDDEIMKIIEKYFDLYQLKETPLHAWITQNRLDIDNLYERLRYPTDKGFEDLTDDLHLKYQEEKILPFIESMIKDSKQLRVLSVTHFRGNEE